MNDMISRWNSICCVRAINGQNACESVLIGWTRIFCTGMAHDKLGIICVMWVCIGLYQFSPGALNTACLL